MPEGHIDSFEPLAPSSLRPSLAWIRILWLQSFVHIRPEGPSDYNRN